jgi:hypothetical protein
MTAIIKKVIQFAVVTPNTDNTVKVLCETLNLGPLKVWDFKHPAIFDTTINDQQKAWSMKLAFGWIGDMQFEVIEPTGGETLYKSYLDQRGHAGVQHLLIDRQEIAYPNMKKVLADAGMPIANEAKSNVAVKLGPITLPPLPMFLARSMSTVFGYTSTLDTMKLVIETSKYPPGIKPRDGIRMGLPSYWSAGDKKQFEALPDNSLITGVAGFIVLVKNIAEVQPYYEKLFGAAIIVNNSLLYKLENNYVKVIQPKEETSYAAIMKERGQGIQILDCVMRQNNKLRNDEIYKEKGFSIINLEEQTTLYSHSNLPFDIQTTL